MSPLPLAEELLLVVAHRAQLRTAASVDRDALLSLARAEHGPSPDASLGDLGSSLDALVARGALVVHGSRVAIAPHVIEIVAPLTRARMCRSFDEWMLRCDASPASHAQCRRTTGLPFLHFATVDGVQLAAMLRAIDGTPRTRIVDLGCGLGTFSEHVSDATGAHVTGIDFAPRAVARAMERTSEKRERLAFAIGDLDALALDEGAFDVALSVDTLYFVEDLVKTIPDVARALGPGGRLVAFYDSIQRDGDAASILEPRGSHLGVALDAAGLRFETEDFTASERAFWSAQREVVAELKEPWAAEGNESLWRSADREARVMSERHEAGRVRRHLYVATR